MRGFMDHHRPIPLLPGRRSNSPTNALQPRAALFRLHRASCASAVLPHALGWSGEEVYPPEPQGWMENPRTNGKAVCGACGIESDLLSSDLGSRSWQLHIFGMSWNHWHGNGGADSVPATFQLSRILCIFVHPKFIFPVVDLDLFVQILIFSCFLRFFPVVPRIWSLLQEHVLFCLEKDACLAPLEFLDHRVLEGLIESLSMDIHGWILKDVPRTIGSSISGPPDIDGW